jgi:hypothetical protein
VRRVGRAAALAAAVVCGFAADVSLAKDPPLPTLTPEHFRDTATLETEPHGGTLISTQNGFKDYSGPLHMLWHDEYLTASIDKKTGSKSFQVHAEITYSGNLRLYQSARYQAADGSRSVAVTQIGKEAANCAVAECIYTERIAFGVDEELLRQLAAAYVPGKPAMWSFKALPKTGPVHSAALSNAEIAGLLLKLDEFTHTPSIVTSSVAAATAAAAPDRLDLGVGGMAVAATEGQPNRAGILIIAVTPGSVAQRSGIIVGDILFDIDAHPVRQPAELQAAIAACKPGSAVPIKLYRGTDPLSLTARF